MKAQNLTTVEHECASCGDMIPVAYERLAAIGYLVKCESCGSRYRVDPDADCVDGDWKDRTTLIPTPETP